MPLHFATELGNIEVVKYLVEKNANVNIGNSESDD
jgi:ankyrin repeat protein